MRYIYFIGYAHSKGFGMMEVNRDAPITLMDEIKEICLIIEKRDDLHSVVVLSFQLLRTENV